METSPEGKLYHVLEITSKKPLLLNCAQEIYSKFLTAILQTVEDFGRDKDCRENEKSLTASNTNLKDIQHVLVKSGLCDEKDAFACTVPI